MQWKSSFKGKKVWKSGDETTQRWPSSPLGHLFVDPFLPTIRGQWKGCSISLIPARARSTCKSNATCSTFWCCKLQLSLYLVIKKLKLNWWLKFPEMVLCVDDFITSSREMMNTMKFSPLQVVCRMMVITIFNLMTSMMMFKLNIW